MRAARLLSKGEAHTIVWRLGGIVLAALASMWSVRVFVGRDPAGAPTLIALMGWLAFLPLLQWGYGRPVYSALRAAFERGAAEPRVVAQRLRQFGGYAVLAVIVMSGLGYGLALHQAYARPAWEVVALAAGLAALISGQFQRDVAYAVSREPLYERVEVARKAINLAGYGLLVAGLPLGAIGLMWLASGLATQYGFARALASRALFESAHLVPSPARQSPSDAGLRADARRFLVFSANEALLYNLPLVLFSLRASPAELLYFGVWYRMFQLLVLPMRVLVDARVNRQVSAFFRADAAGLKRELSRSAWLALGLVAVGWLLLLPVIGSVLVWLRVPVMAGDPWLLAALGIWCLGNAVQHTYGSFVLSYGGGFRFGLRASLLSTAVMLPLYVGMQISGAGVGVMLTTGGLVYASLTLLYRRHALNCAAGLASKT